MVVLGYRRVDIDDDNVHGYSFYNAEPSADINVIGLVTFKDFVNDNLQSVQSVLINAQNSGEDVCVLRNRSGKITDII